MRTWLAVAAERREFEGIVGKFGNFCRLEWPGVRFARQAQWKGDRWLLVASGPGPALARRALGHRMDVSGVISTGFCGALDPALRVGDIVVRSDSTVESGMPFVRGEILSGDRVAVSAEEKRSLRERTGAIAIEMEAAEVARKAAEWGVPFHCVRAVSDIAEQDLPLDFNSFRDEQGRFSRSRIALAAIARPFSVMPALLAFDRDCQRAAQVLGEFFADCRF